MAQRVEIPAYTDRWMMGDRCGEVLGNARNMGSFPPGDVIRVKLDKRGKVVRVLANDCRYL